MKNARFRLTKLLSLLLAFSVFFSLFIGIIHINADFQGPPPSAPYGIYVEAVDSDTIKLEWNIVPEVNHYEIYIANYPNSNLYTNYIYVGSINASEASEGRLRYYVEGLSANTWYSFKLKAVNDNGPSALSYETSYVITKDKTITNNYLNTGDYIGGIAQNDKTSILGSGLTFVTGESSLGNFGAGLTVDFNQKNYMNYEPKNINIGLELLKKYPNNSIAIIEKDFTLKMLSNNLLSKEVTAGSYGRLPDSKMTIAVMKDLKAKGDEIKSKVPKGYKALTVPVGISLTMQVGETKTNIKTLNGSAELSFNISDASKKLYVGGVIIAQYNNDTGRLERLNAQTIGKNLTAQITKPGEYILLGKLTK